MGRGEKKKGKKERCTETASIHAEFFSPGLRPSKAGTSDQHYSGAPLPFPVLFWLMHFSARAQMSWLAARQEHVPDGLDSCLCCKSWEAKLDRTVEACGQQGSVPEPKGRHELSPLLSDC